MGIGVLGFQFSQRTFNTGSAMENWTGIHKYAWNDGFSAVVLMIRLGISMYNCTVVKWSSFGCICVMIGICSRVENCQPFHWCDTFSLCKRGKNDWFSWWRWFWFPMWGVEMQNSFLSWKWKSTASKILSLHKRTLYVWFCLLMVIPFVLITSGVLN